MEHSNSVISAFSKCRVLQGLQAADILELSKKLTLEHFKKDSMMIKQNEPTSKIYFVIEGEVEIVLEISQSLNERMVATLGAGETVGEFALLTNSRRSASARAL